MSRRNNSRVGSRSGAKKDKPHPMSIPTAAQQFSGTAGPKPTTGPIPMGSAFANDPNPFPPPRPIIDRMTNPSAADQNVGNRIRALSRPQVEMAISHVCQALEHLATQRDDVHVTRTQDESGITVRVEFG